MAQPTADGTSRGSPGVVDNRPVMLPDAPGQASTAPRVLDRLRGRARAGDITVTEFLEGCRTYTDRELARRIRSYRCLESSDAEDFGQEVWAALVMRKGGEDWLFPTVDLLTAYFSTSIDNYLRGKHTKRGGRPVEVPIHDLTAGSHGRAPSAELADPAAERRIAEVAAAVDRQAAATAARDVLRRRGPQLRELAQASEGPSCPFHYARPCPHTAQVLEFVERHGVRLDELEDVAEALAAAGRALSLSDRDHSLDRHFRRCFEWWRYRAFAGTCLDPAAGRGADLTDDQPSSPVDRLRLPIVGRLRLRQNGSWDAVACSLRGARALITPDDEFRRLLQVRRPEVHAYLFRNGRTD
ncbi:hypothetical protein [Parafrankia sp. EUN1f]|uniref:hypothetical protein n=1 Tax=Parafrankia sp. EUN1f TaxID=102897 RepID=UPI0001C474B5|nr:hypothetical protein [Parafrankia sp. EUN1f]EFC79867.1 hypothetical protein FrEUN1fDRAFT_7013 [Parafrankia sp. EUN1f]